MTKLKSTVLEIVEIVKECPENLQALCFELLLRHELDSLLPAKKQKESTEGGSETDEKPTERIKPIVEETAKSQEDLSEVDLHVKVKHFMKKHGVSLEQLNNHYKEDSAILPLYEDLKTTRMAEAQIRISLLQSLQNAIADGEFQCQVANVRTECNERKCYDGGNFAKNFKNNASLFDGDYDKSTASMKLSEDGKKELADIIKELQ